MTHSKLASGQVSDTTGIIYAASGVTAYIKTIILHNLNSTTEIVTFYDDGNGDAQKILVVPIDPNETITWEFDHMLIVADGDNIQADTTLDNYVNYRIYGASE